MKNMGIYFYQRDQA